jgi:hypothetical protein
MIGKVVGDPYIDRVRNGTGNALHLQVEFGSNDVQTVQYMPHSGDDVVPAKGSIVEVVRDNGTLIGIASYDKIESSAEAGSREIYSTNQGVKKAQIKLNYSGAIGAKNLVTGMNLLTALEAITTALSTFATACEGSQTDPMLVTAATALATNVTLAKAKLEEVLYNL